jgi:hypothetical protein
VRHALGQGVQAEEQQANRQHGEDQNDGHHRHEDVGLARAGDERRQIMGGSGVKRCSHADPPLEVGLALGPQILCDAAFASAAYSLPLRV